MKVFLALVAVCAVVSGANIKSYKPMLDGRIVGGEDTNIEELPHQLSLQRNGRHICGASIVNERTALTAAHCCDGASSSSLSLRAGSSIRGNGGSVHQVEHITMHPQYNSWTIDFDLCVLRVATPFPIGPGVQPISPARNEPSAGTPCVVSGWGALSAGGLSPSQLQSTVVPIVGRSQCNALLGFGSITSRMICAGLDEGGRDSCQGDSGGPLVCDGVLAGVVSWGYGCADPWTPGVYANVANQIDWIEANSRF